ncbi:MAG: ATP-binding cassette domain-containing protein [Chloroflexi bacterium]|nr:ATP-binding cassette domain-containing protein [Chloroflexota bacterium]
MQASDLTKSFGSVAALRGATLELRAGEVLGVVGDNGAGKSTLIKTLSGVVAPDRGTIFFAGELVHFSSPRAARSLGIETVYQDLALCEHLTVARNLYLGRELTRHGLPWLDDRRMARSAEQFLERLGIVAVPGDAVVRNLSGGQRQAVAVAKAVAFSPRVLILDEPTAALGVREVEQVLDLVRRVRADGVGVILITHRMQDLFEVCDRLLIMYEGTDIARLTTKNTTLEEIVYYIDGGSGREHQRAGSITSAS